MKNHLTCLALIVMITGCASTAPPPEERVPHDPWEGFNRSVFQFNTSFDDTVVRPAARSYKRVTPEPVRNSIRNFFANVRSPVVVFNLILQGRGNDAGEELKRFFVNSVYGIGGLFDIASAGGLEKHNEDFGQTLAVWGWEDSRFLVLPFFGPATVRDGVGRLGDIPANAVQRWTIEKGTYGLIVLDVIQMRADLLPLDADIREAYDPYTFMRDGWTQRRRNQIHEGDQPLPDYDSFLEEIEPGEDY